MRSRRLLAVLFALGVYLTLRGYHSRDGDQAYRLPLLVHAQDPAVFSNDPFVRAFDAFNPHQGYLAILGGLSRWTGLSLALFGLFCATFVMTVLAVDHATRAVWPDRGRHVGFVAVALFLIAKAGNLGTNHLFEAMLLDRLMALALGWWAIAGFIASPSKRSWLPAVFVLAAAFVHPSIGLQLGLLLLAGWVGGWLVQARSGIRWRDMVVGVVSTLIALAPFVWLIPAQSRTLFAGMAQEEFLTLSASVQSPQHMLPHLWRLPQWLAGGCYVLLAVVAAVGGARDRVVRCDGRSRLLLLLAITLVALGIATAAIELFHSARITLFQPYRMATVARGLCLILIAERIRLLWTHGAILDRTRAAILVFGLAVDWAFVIATIFDLSTLAAEQVWDRIAQIRTVNGLRLRRFVQIASNGLAPLLVLMFGLNFLAKHDPESGHWVLLGAIGSAVSIHFLVPRLLSRLGNRSDRFFSPRGRRVLLATGLGLAWLVPICAAVVPTVSGGRFGSALAVHCRFGEWPEDDVERLALWCRENTPLASRFIGPPGPKTFRLWSEREVAFNRAASPYHAAGLADWAARFREHVDFHGSIAEFSRYYLANRQELEKRYDRLDSNQLARLADREGAEYVLAAAKIDPGDSLTRLRVQGRYAVYRVLKAQESARIVSSRLRM